MANTLSDLKPTFWAKEAQRSLFVENKALLIANTTLADLLAGEGNAVNRTILSYPRRQTYTPGTDMVDTPLVGSKETLTVNTYFTTSVTIDDTEKVQSIVDTGKLAMKRMMQNHNNSIEQAVLDQIVNSAWSIDDAALAGTSGNNGVVNSSNVPMLFTGASGRLDATDVPQAGRTALIGTHTLQQLRLQQAGRNTNFGDVVNARGEVGQLFGWNIVVTNNLPFSALLTLSTIPTAADTFSIAGVQFQAAANGAATNAGDFSIGNTAADAIIYATAAINFNSSLTAVAPSLTSANNGTMAAAATTFIDVSAENRFLLTDKRRVVATGTSTTIAITGYGDIVLGESLTPAADVWSAELQKSLFCVSGCVDQIVQIPPAVETYRVQKQWADGIKSMLGYGVKLYADGAREMVYAKIDANRTNSPNWAS